MKDQHFGEKLAILKEAVRKVAKLTRTNRCTEPSTEEQTCPMATFLADRS